MADTVEDSKEEDGVEKRLLREYILVTLLSCRHPYFHVCVFPLLLSSSLVTVA